MILLLRKFHPRGEESSVINYFIAFCANRCTRLRCPRLDCPPACYFPIRVILTPYRFIPWPLWPMLKHCRPDILARGHLSLLHRKWSNLFDITHCDKEKMWWWSPHETLQVQAILARGTTYDLNTSNSMISVAHGNILIQVNKDLYVEVESPCQVVNQWENVWTCTVWKKNHNTCMKNTCKNWMKIQ